MATLQENIRQVNSDFQAIKSKIIEKGVAIADGTKTSEYASKIDEVYEAGKGEGGGGGAQPTLNKPELDLNLYTSTLTITDALNGNFVDGYEIYIDNTLITTVTDKTVVLTNYTEINEAVTVKVRAVGENFIDSELATVEWTKPPLYTPVIAVDNITDVLTITDANDEVDVRGYEIYANGALLATVTEKSVTLSQYMTIAETQEIKVKALSGSVHFLDSNFSNSVMWFEKSTGTAGLAIVYDNNKYYYRGIGSATDADIVLSTFYEGNKMYGIKSYAFRNASITSVYIADGIELISPRAFESCKNLQSVRLGVDSIWGEGIFISCTALTQVIFANGGKSNSIATEMFSNCSSLERLDIPEGVTHIGTKSFHRLTSLKELRLPESILFIAGNAFSETTQPFDIYYAGSEEQWANISISDKPSNFLTNATIHFNS